MKRLFIGLTATGLATMLMSVSVDAGALVFDAAGKYRNSLCALL
jgi:hypothetical protein